MRLIHSTTSILTIIAAIILSSSCQKENSQQPDQIKDCLLFYASGGDFDHDYSLFKSIELACEATAEHPGITVATLFLASGEGEGVEHNGVRRYTAQNGILSEDKTFSPAGKYDITDPANLTDFLKWAKEQFPGCRYTLIFGGHGRSFSPHYDIPETKATLSSEEGLMTSSEFAKGIKDADIRLAAMIAHSCQQGSIETIAEWEGLADYYVCSPLSIPDIAYDYAPFIADLSKGYVMEYVLTRFAERTMDLWELCHQSDGFGSVIEVIKIGDLDPLWNVLSDTFRYMEKTMNDINHTTDAPAVYEATYGEGYYNAFYISHARDTEPFDEFSPDKAIDMPLFLNNAFVYSGNIALATYINNLNAVLDEIIVAHYQSDGEYTYCLNAYDMSESSETADERYRTCRFDQLTHWSDLAEKIMEYKQE